MERINKISMLANAFLVICSIVLPATLWAEATKNVTVVNEPANAVPVELVNDAVEVQGAVDAYVLNGIPAPDDFVVLRTTNQPVADTVCTGAATRPLVRSFGLSSENGKQFIVPAGKQLVITDFSWTADLRTGALAFAGAVGAAIQTTGGNGASLYETPFVNIADGDFVAGGSEDFGTGLIARAGAEVCVLARFIRASDASGPFSTALETFATTIHGYLADE